MAPWNFAFVDATAKWVWNVAGAAGGTNNNPFTIGGFYYNPTGAAIVGATFSANSDDYIPAVRLNGTTVAGMSAAGWNITATATITIKDATGTVVKTLVLTAKPVNAPQKATFKATLKKGKYKFYVTAVDAAGNPSANVSFNKLTVK